MKQAIKHPEVLARNLRKVWREMVFPAYCHESNELRAEDRQRLLEKLPRWARCSEVDFDMLINRVACARADLALHELNFWMYQAEQAAKAVA